ncbi:MAG: rhomboid family intramembrane serine protease, partial [Pseudomonadota bacterium]
MHDRPRATPKWQSGNQPSLVDRARPIVILIGVIWAVFLLDLILPLEKLGLVPRSLVGLIGIVTMPFLHGSFGHLLSN